MSKPAVVNGKVMRTPSLEVYDDKPLPATPVPHTHVPVDRDPRRDFKVGLFIDDNAPRTQGADRALLVALGVDGDVPFDEAAVNAGLTTVGQERRVRFANKRGQWRLGVAQNHEVRTRKVGDVGIGEDGWVLRAPANDNTKLVAAKAA